MLQSTQRSITALGLAAVSLASLPTAKANTAELAQGSASDLGVMSINLKDVV